MEQFSKILARIVSDFSCPVLLPRFILETLADSAHFLSRAFKLKATMSGEKVKEMYAGSWWADDSKARRLLGFHPKWDLEHGLKDTYLWYRVMGW
jgi:nucleoside-diphosphate-sugar epimerase